MRAAVRGARRCKPGAAQRERERAADRPAPRIRTSIAAAGIAHQRFDVVDALGRFGGEHLAAACA